MMINWKAIGSTGHLNDLSALKGICISTKIKYLPDTAQIEGEKVNRINSSYFTTLRALEPVKTITDSSSPAEGLSNATLNTQNDREMTENAPNEIEGKSQSIGSITAILRRRTHRNLSKKL
jgi:hypothetical protein